MRDTVEVFESPTDRESDPEIDNFLVVFVKIVVAKNSWVSQTDDPI